MKYTDSCLIQEIAIFAQGDLASPIHLLKYFLFFLIFNYLSKFVMYLYSLIHSLFIIIAKNNSIQKNVQHVRI